MKHIIIYMSRGDKYFLISDSHGYFHTFSRSTKFRSSFYSGFKDIRTVVKHFVNVLFTAENKLGFVKFTENQIGSIICDAGSYSILTATLDSMVTSLIYAATVEGDVLVFESFNNALRTDAVDCKLLGRFET